MSRVDAHYTRAGGTTAFLVEVQQAGIFFVAGFEMKLAVTVYGRTDDLIPLREGGCR